MNKVKIKMTNGDSYVIKVNENNINDIISGLFGMKCDPIPAINISTYDLYDDIESGKCVAIVSSHISSIQYRQK